MEIEQKCYCVVCECTCTSYVYIYADNYEQAVERSQEIDITKEHEEIEDLRIENIVEIVEE